MSGPDELGHLGLSSLWKNPNATSHPPEVHPRTHVGPELGDLTHLLLYYGLHYPCPLTPLAEQRLKQVQLLFRGTMEGGTSFRVLSSPLVLVSSLSQGHHN